MIGSLVTRFASGLRFPVLFALVGGLFLVDVLLPDLVPFIDELMLALGTLLLGSLRKPRGDTVRSAPAAESSKNK